MKKCKCCDNITNKEACSIEHAYAYRYLKKFDLSETDIAKICLVKTNLSIKYKHIIWSNNLDTHPLCLMCSKELSNKKILVNNKTTSRYCSSKCYNEYKKTLVKSSNNVNKDIKRELKKFTDLEIESYIQLLLEKYKDVSDDLLYINKLYINNLDNNPTCKFCKNTHNKTRNQKIRDCCSIECSNVYRKYKMSYEEIFQYYLQQQIDYDFLINIDMFELAHIYNNKKRDIKKCHCGKYTIDNYCSIDCRNKDNMTNINDFNKQGFLKFISKNKFDAKKAIIYYNCSMSTIQRYKKKFGIKIRNKHTVEDDVIMEISKFYNKEPIKNDRSIIKPKELDILYDTFAIEYNGLLWHSNKSIYNNSFNYMTHIDKTDMCEKLNIKLFHIFENEWLYKKQIWLNLIEDFCFNKINNSRLYLETINQDIAQTFFDTNYLEKIMVNNYNCVGIYSDGDLISVSLFKESILYFFCTKKYYFDLSILEQILDYYLYKSNYQSITIHLNKRWQHYNMNKKFKFLISTTPNKYHIISKSNVINNYDYINFYNRTTEYPLIFDSGYNIYEYTGMC